MSKLTRRQKQELKVLVANATIRRLTSKEISVYIFEKLGVSITEEYVRRVRMDIRHDYTKELQLIRKDKDYYLQCLFSDRVAELEYQQRVLHEIIDNNKESNPDVVIRAVSVLHDISSSIFKEYTNLPTISAFRFPILPEPEPLGPSPLNPSQPHPTELNNHHDKEPIL
jgi:hypothetical protein